MEVERPNLSLCLPKSLQEGGRAGLGDVVPPHGCPRGLCIPLGGLPCLLPALPTRLTPKLQGQAGDCGQAGALPYSLAAHRAAWVCASPAPGVRAAMGPDLDVLPLLQYGCLLRGMISAGNYTKSHLINTNGTEGPGQHWDSFPNCLSGVVRTLHRKAFRVMFFK